MSNSEDKSEDLSKEEECEHERVERNKLVLKLIGARLPAGSMLNIKSKIKEYADEQAFICHSVDHWLAIRKIHGVWYNLNSTNIMPPGPQIISNFYLSAFLDSIKNSGYTIFVIRCKPGQSLPDPKKP